MHELSGVTPRDITDVDSCQLRPESDDGQRTGV